MACYVTGRTDRLYARLVGLVNIKSGFSEERQVNVIFVVGGSVKGTPYFTNLLPSAVYFL